MYGFDIFFGTCLLVSSIISYKFLRSARKYNIVIRAFRFIIISICTSFWIWLLLFFTVPKGHKLEEGVHIPRHLSILDEGTFVEDIPHRPQAYGQHSKQYYNYYPAPANSPKKNTVIVHFHGGAWCAGSPYQHRYLAKLFHDQGYTVILPAYRLTPEVAYPEFKKDITNFLAHSVDFLKQEGIQAPQLILGGTSAGGNLAALLSYDETTWQSLNISRSLLKGTYSIAGVLDLNHMEQTYQLLSYTGPVDQPNYQQANPITWISSQDSFPFLCLHGDKDGLAAYENAVSFCNQVNNVLPNQAQLKTFKDATHIEVGSSWYYNPKDNWGQDSTLLQWIVQVSGS